MNSKAATPIIPTMTAVLFISCCGVLSDNDAVGYSCVGFVSACFEEAVAAL